MCDSDFYDVYDQGEVRDHFEWHSADEKRRLTQGLAGCERKEYPWNSSSNGKSEKQKNTTIKNYCFE